MINKRKMEQWEKPKKNQKTKKQPTQQHNMVLV